MRPGVLLGARHLGVGPPVPAVGDEHRVVAEARRCPRRSAAMVPSTTPWAATSRPPGKQAMATVRNRARRRLGARGARPRRARRAAWPRCRRRWRAPRSSATRTPRARRPARRPPARCHRRWRAAPWPRPGPCALSRALSSRVSPVSSTSPTDGGPGHELDPVPHGVGQGPRSRPPCRGWPWPAPCASARSRRRRCRRRRPEPFTEGRGARRPRRAAPRAARRCPARPGPRARRARPG